MEHSKFNEKNSCCIKCKKTFSNINNLRKHVKGIHVGEDTYLKSLQTTKSENETVHICCDICENTFSNRFNLKRHFERFHLHNSMKIKRKVVLNKPKMTKQCSICNREFVSLSNLKRHMKQLHREQKVSKLQNIKNDQVLCDQCPRMFKHITNLNIHLKTHNTPKHSTQLLNTVKCVFCNYYSNKKSLLMHYIHTHNLQIEEERYTFNDIENFFSWKLKYENVTTSRFIKECNTIRDGYVLKTFKCHRSGNFLSRSKGIRHLKIQGSVKINGFCPASIKLKQNCMGQYDVHVMKTHVGHQLEVKHLNLTKFERMSLATKIALKIPFDDILDEIRNSLCDSNLKRLHILTKKDLYNIETSFNLCSTSVRHSNDLISVESWIRDMQQKSDAILFYKPQGCILQNWNQLKEEDFALVIMTDAQAQMLQKYGSDCICIDGTHGISGYNFQLITLLVVDDVRQGFPCGFLISNRTDKYVISIFLQHVKNKIGSALSPNVFMSDMDNAFINAWLAVMSPPKLRLFCTWHVDQAWRKNIKTKVKTKEKQLSVYKLVRMLLEERNGEAFYIMLNKFYENCILDQDTLDFADYFKSYYMTNTESWAYCNRLGVGLNTNMHLERMHRTLKHTYLKGQNVKRLDKGIIAIMRLVRDKCIDRLIVLNKGKLTKKIQLIRSHHTTSLKMDLNLVTSTDNGWNVISKDMEELHTIKKVKEHCDCQLCCVHCQTCLHQYICSCIDSSIRYNMCKHIHLVCRHSMNQNDSTYLDFFNDSTPTSSNMQECQAHLTDLNAAAKNRTLSEPLDITRRKLKDDVKQLLQLIDLEGPEEILAIKNTIASIGPTLEAIKASKKLVTKCVIQPQNNTPHNKKIIQQRRLVSTKKKRK